MKNVLLLSALVSCCFTVSAQEHVHGQGPSVIFALVLLEALMLVLIAIASAISLVSGALALFSDELAAHYGLFLSANLLSWETLQIAVIIALASIVTSAIPAFDAYKSALQSRLSGKG